MKKAIAIFLLLCMMLNSISVFAADNTPAYTEAAGLGILPEGFQANGTQAVTREGFIGMAVKAIEEKTGKSAAQLLEERQRTIGKNPFGDTTNQTIIAACYLGLTDTVSGSLRPKDPLTRQEAAVILTNAADVLGRYTYNLPSNYKDKAKIDAKASNSVDYVTHRKIMGGDSKGNFSPKDKCTAEQALSAMLKLYKDDGKLNISKAERTKIAEAGRAKQAATNTVSSIYPQAGISRDGKQWEINLGDVIGYALETSTAVYIDGRYVKSYAIGAYKAIDIDDLAQFGYIIRRDQKNKMIAIIRDGKADRKEYNDRVDKSQVLSGNVVYTLIANNITVKTFDSRSPELALAHDIPAYTTTAGKTLIPVEALKIVNNVFTNEGRIAYVVPDSAKNEVRLYTLANTDVPFATNRYWVANKYPGLAASILTEDERTALAKAQSLVKELIKPEMGEFEREKAIYDYLVQYGRYDYNAYNLVSGFPLNPDSLPANKNAFSIYGGLIDGLAVCQGWTEAYYAVLTLAGLEVQKQFGDLDGGPHTWVSVKVDGAWYQIETTNKAKKGDPGFYGDCFNFSYEKGRKSGYSAGDRRATEANYEHVLRRDSEANFIVQSRKEDLESNEYLISLSSTVRTKYEGLLDNERRLFEERGIRYPTSEEERDMWRKLGYRFINRNAPVDSDGYVQLKDLYE